VNDRDDRLLKDINRRNWILLTLLCLISLLWQSISVTLGVLGGSLLAIIAHHWRYRALLGILGNETFGAARRFQVGYIIRLGTLALAIYALIGILKVHPIALVAGLSVVIINIFFTTWQRSF
jgi:ATP synthase I chain